MAKKKTTKKPASGKAMTKGEVYHAVAEKTGLTRKQVVEVLDATTDIMIKEVKKSGSFNFIGLMKMTLVKKPAVKGGKLVRNPFTGEMVKQKPKPASKSVKVTDEGIKDQL